MTSFSESCHLLLDHSSIVIISLILLNVFLKNICTVPRFGRYIFLSKNYGWQLMFEPRPNNSYCNRKIDGCRVSRPMLYIIGSRKMDRLRNLAGQTKLISKKIMADGL